MPAYTVAKTPGLSFALPLNRPMNLAPAPLILVVGMHRSGTSLLTSILHAIGITTPGELIAGDAHNPQGYFERRDITDLQEGLLRDLGRWWPGASGFYPMPSGWQQREPTRLARERLSTLLRAGSQRHNQAWAIKDPRTSLLLPLWRDVATELGLELRLLLALRDPAEVMVSLLERDTQLAGMTPWRAQQLWWHHNRQILLESNGLPLLTIHYEQWFQPRAAARQLQALSRFCGLSILNAADQQRALAAIQPAHRRSLRPKHQLPLPIQPQLRAFHQRLASQTAAELRAWLEARPPSRLLPPPAKTNGSRQRLEVQLRELKARQRGVGWEGCPDWFDADHYRRQKPDLAIETWRVLLEHFQQHGVQESLCPHPLLDPTLRPLSTQCQPWLIPMAEAAPFGAAAIELACQNTFFAQQLLLEWRQGHWQRLELHRLASCPSGSFPLLTQPPDLPQPPYAEVTVLGSSWNRWPVHALLQHLPLALNPSTLQLHHQLQNGGLALHLQAVCVSRDTGLLPQLANQKAVFDPVPERVDLLRRLGVPAHPLLIAPCPGNLWLREALDLEEACCELGLPPSKGLVNPGEGLSSVLITLGSGGTLWEQQLEPPCWGLPGFDQLELSTPHQARMLAAWLDKVNRMGLQLVRLEPTAEETTLAAFRALTTPQPSPPGWMPPQAFYGEITHGELQSELAWRRAGCPPPVPCTTPEPRNQCLWQHDTDQHPTAAVCISLYNYADRLEQALNSVARQSHNPLELIVVDDASSDGGATVALRWLERHRHRFSRALLLQHNTNAGLAAARNTAFACAAAPWCFVLDADNELLPNAVALTLQLASFAPAQTAVVHPLVQLHYESFDAFPRGLISSVSWQQQALRHGNRIDAMALVRHASWQEVGGYTHIPGGWEDFDFWCKLIDAGLHGVLCPQRLAVYRVHGSSMAATATRSQERHLSRVLQSRHPWLDLPKADTDPSLHCA